MISLMMMNGGGTMVVAMMTLMNLIPLLLHVNLARKLQPRLLLARPRHHRVMGSMLKAQLELDHLLDLLVIHRLLALKLSMSLKHLNVVTLKQ